MIDIFANSNLPPILKNWRHGTLLLYYFDDDYDGQEIEN